MVIKKLWFVRDPSAISELADIFGALEVPKGLGNYIRGTNAEDYNKENHAFYDSEAEARKEAEKRMAKKGTYKR